MLALWTSGETQKLFIVIALLLVVICAAGTWRNLREFGLSVSELRESAWVVFVALIVAAGLVVIASRLHTLHVNVRGRPPAMSITAYALWALLQEFILVNVFLSRLLRILQSRTAAVIVVAVLFAAAHIPNPLLMAITLPWGAVACMLFLRYRNLYTLALAHAIVGLTLAITIPDAMQHQMRVGIGYLHWHAPVSSALSKPQ
jgi:membrane protease YdiL (CAAX protease family)